MIKQLQVTTILNKHKQRDGWFLTDYSVNPYSGCSCNCQYCYIRGSKYGENLAENLSIKENAPELLRKQLAARARKADYGIIALGSATDAYLHQENENGMTRALLEIILEFRFPVFISTKCGLLRRDIDLLLEIDKTAILPPDLQGKLKRGLHIAVSISTLDATIARQLEPGADAPADRLALLSDLRDNGFCAGINAMPLLPFISDTDTQLHTLFETAAKRKASFMYTAGLTLFGNKAGDSKPLYYHFLRRNYPSLQEKYNRLYDRNDSAAYIYHQELTQRLEQLYLQYAVPSHILQALP